jgi:hypothetical protein
MVFLNKMSRFELIYWSFECAVMKWSCVVDFRNSVHGGAACTVQRALLEQWADARLILDSGLTDRNLLSTAIGSFIHHRIGCEFDNDLMRMLFHFGADPKGVGIRASECRDRRARTCIQATMHLLEDCTHRRACYHWNEELHLGRSHFQQALRFLLESGAEPDLTE